MLLTLGVAALFLLMAYDRRPLADYGLAVAPGWVAQAIAGCALAAAFYALYYGLAIWLGVFTLQWPDLVVGNVLKLTFALAAAVPIAAAQQMIFSGYILTKLRNNLGILPGLVLTAVMFGIAASWSGRFDLESLRLPVGLFCVALLLGVARLTTGSIVFPTSLLLGALVVRRIVKETGILKFQADAGWVDVIAPAGDTRQGLLMAVMLLVASIGYSIKLYRDGEPATPQNHSVIDAGFKRVMPFSNLLGLAPIELWLAKLRQAGWRVGWKYVPRFLVTLFVSALNSLLILPERILAPLVIRHQVRDPVFIVGVHRTGTTHLHNLMACDPQFCFPRSYQVFNPHGFLTGWLTTLLIGPFMTVRRPMDGVRITPFSPQEEEFAIAGMSKVSPYWFACLPKLYSAHERFIYPECMTPAELKEWRQAYVWFCQKISWWSRARPLLKSPYNTARVALLAEMFPGARFIHIVRHPHQTYRSNMHLAEHGWAVFQLQDPDKSISFATEFLTNFRQQEAAYDRDAAMLPAGRAADVRFEDLEADPLRELARIYDGLGLQRDAAVEERWREYLTGLSGYEKNRFEPLCQRESQHVDAVMRAYMHRWSYDAR